MALSGRISVPRPLFKNEHVCTSTMAMSLKLPSADRAQFQEWVGTTTAHMAIADQDDEPAIEQKENKCIECGKPAKLRCSICQDTPVVFKSDPDLAYYCDKDCSVKHWATHKPICRRLLDRKRLYRAGEFLRELFYVRQEEAFGFKIDRVVKKGSEIYWFHEPIAPFADVYHKVGRAHFEGDEQLMRKFFAANAGNATQACWHRIMHKVLNDFVDHNNMFEVSFEHKGPGSQTIEYSRGYLCGDRSGLHPIWQIHLSENEVFALDIIGAQIGCHDAVLPWFEYEKRHVKKYREVRKFESASQQMVATLSDDQVAFNPAKLVAVQSLFRESAITSYLEDVLAHPAGMPDLDGAKVDYGQILKNGATEFQHDKEAILGSAKDGLKLKIWEYNAELGIAEDKGTMTFKPWPTATVPWQPGVEVP